VNFNNHSELKDRHAFLSPSKYHWVNYDEDKLEEVYTRQQAAQRGTALHNFAMECILLKQKLPRSTKSLNAYVNDAIGYRMTPEQLLFYSLNAFGTADAISFNKKFLRIHDLKTGIIRIASMLQLEVYAAYFCLEYDHNPEEIEIELRKYQLEGVIIHNPVPEDIRYIMNKTISFDKRIEILKLEG